MRNGQSMTATGRLAIRQQNDSRRGIATLWILMTVPAVVILFFFVVDIGNIWLARIELTNAVESAAQAAVKTWGEGGTKTQARRAAKDFAAANTVIGEPVILNLNKDTMNTNDNKNCRGNIVLGSLVPASSPIFNSCIEPDCSARPLSVFAVRIQVAVPVQSLFGNLFGISTGPYEVSSAATAGYWCQSRSTHLVRIGEYQCSLSCP